MPKDLKELESDARRIGSAVKEMVDPRAGFVLLLFDREPGGNMTYLANADRGDMVALLWEFMQKLEGDESNPSPRLRRQLALEEISLIIRHLSTLDPSNVCSHDGHLAAIKAIVESKELVARFDAR